MSYKLPFTESMVKEQICGRTFVYAYKRTDNNLTRVMKEIELAAEKDDPGLKWRIDNGRLMILDGRDSVTDMIDSLQVINGQVMLTGEAYHLSGPVPGRLMLYERSELGTDYQIVISSHVDYEATTVPRVVKSLLRAGVPDNIITVVVAGCKDEEITQEKGYVRVPVGKNLMGSTGLLPIVLKQIDLTSSYVLLMHDTCEVSIDFQSVIQKVEVGAPYDFIEGNKEIGLWSARFLSELPDVYDISTDTARFVFNHLKDLCKLSRCHKEQSDLKSKDVYGNGNSRMVRELKEFGIKKYLGSDAATMKP